MTTQIFKYIVFVLMGLISILIGCFNDNFYYAKSLQGAVLSDKPAPLWLGRALFILVGIALTLYGIKHLFCDIY